MFHQEYVWANTSRLQEELAEIEGQCHLHSMIRTATFTNSFVAAGFKAIFLTVDNTGVQNIRNRQQRFSSGGDSGHSLNFTIADLASIRNMTPLPIVPKGVKTAHDVKLCADLGFPAVYISNHGGRVVDMSPTAAEVLLDVRRLYPEVFDQIEIYADGGVRRASHILTLLALGARAVGVGRPIMFANIYGEEGVAKVIDVLNDELETTMRLMGEGDIGAYVGNKTFVSPALRD